MSSETLTKLGPVFWEQITLPFPPAGNMLLVQLQMKGVGDDQGAKKGLAGCHVSACRSEAVIAEGQKHDSRPFEKFGSGRFVYDLYGLTAEEIVIVVEAAE